MTLFFKRFLMIGLMGTMASWVSAQEPAVSQALSEQPVADIVAPVVPSVVPVENVVDPVADSGNISLDFKEADIKNVLKILALKSGFNIITTPDVMGSVTIQLTDVPWQEALNVILSTYGYAYEKKGNIIIVSTVADLKKRREEAVTLAEQEDLVTETFVLNFTTPESVIESLKKLNSSRGTIDFDQRTNMLIVTDVQSKIDQIAQAIKKLDSTTPQILIEGKIIETGFTDEENLGIDWVLQATVSGSERPHNWPFGDSTEDNRFTVDPWPGTDEFTYGTLDFSGLQAVFNALKSRDDTNVISSPRIVTLDNQPAMINVGSQYPIPTYTYNEDQGKLQVSGWEYKDIGIQFEVTPHANQAGYVTLSVKPTVTDILGFVTVENTTLPRLSNESAETNVMIKDGQTLVIAGLVRTKKSDTRKKVPFLGAVPVVKYLFSNKDKSDEKSEMMIFLTPHILDADGNIKAENAMPQI